jgi:DNA-binding PadR family transcriptional regulator
MARGQRGPEGGLLVTPAAFHILLALADGERHGYAIMRAVADETDGTVRLGPGTLYRSLRDLLAAGLIAESDARPDPALDDERRRYYRLTPGGAATLQAEVYRLARLVDLARGKSLMGAAWLLPRPEGS